MSHPHTRALRRHLNFFKQSGKRGPNDWPLEKNWKHLYTRHVKLKRARQLRIDYPVRSMRQRINEDYNDELAVYL